MNLRGRSHSDEISFVTVMDCILIEHRKYSTYFLVFFFVDCKQQEAVVTFYLLSV